MNTAALLFHFDSVRFGSPSRHVHLHVRIHRARSTPSHTAVMVNDGGERDLVLNMTTAGGVLKPAIFFLFLCGTSRMSRIKGHH